MIEWLRRRAHRRAAIRHIVATWGWSRAGATHAVDVWGFFPYCPKFNARASGKESSNG
jgi:hypothetical protein